MKPAAPGYATGEHLRLAGEIRRRYRTGERVMSLLREYGIPVDVLRWIVEAHSKDGAAKILSGFRITECKDKDTV